MSMNFSSVKRWFIGSQEVKQVTNAAGTILWKMVSWVLGSEIQTESSSDQTSNITGYSAITFDEDTGTIAYSGSSSSKSLSSLYSSGSPVYTALSSDAHTVTLKRVTDEGTSTVYEESDWSLVSSGYAEYDTDYDGYANYEFNEVDGYSVSVPHTVNIWEGDSGIYESIYRLNGNTLTRIDFHVGSAYSNIEMETYEATQSSSTKTTYTVKTYTRTASAG